MTDNGPSNLPPPLDTDTLRVMLSTDNHLGYNERDPVRGNDSFAAFEEVLYLATKFECDLVLLAGDLFHDNRPSRRTLHKTLEILRKYVMGNSKAIQIQILSDQQTNFQSGIVNYQDESYAIDLPIFSIHGNHDDPSRDPGSKDLLAALDLLSVTNLVNYFGRHDDIDKIDISPVLLQKGSTKVALYGLGSMRDERLNRMWQGKKVRFLRPQTDDTVNHEDGESDYFFNMFALHQNRDLGRGSKNCIQELMIPEWMDVVVWGHEHECLIDFSESVVGSFRITQPGSSVATSLVSGEAVRKYVGLLDIKGERFRMHKVPLTQVRSFITTEISLKEHRSNLDPEHPDIDKQVTKILDEEVRYMVANARDQMKDVLAEARESGNDAGDADSALKNRLEKPNEVLVRIRVESSGFSTLNNQRFGARYVGEVANPSDILLFHRRKQHGAKKVPSGLKKMIPEELERTNMEDLVSEYLEGQNLTILEGKKLNEALEEYVEKNLIATIPDTTSVMLKRKQKELMATNDVDKDGKRFEKASEVRNTISSTKSEKSEPSKQTSSRSKRSDKGVYDDMEVDEAAFEKENSHEEEDIIQQNQTPRVDAPKKRATANKAAPTDPKRKAARRRQLLDEDSEGDGEDFCGAGSAKRSASARPKRASTKRAKRYQVDDGGSDEDAAFDLSDDEDEVLVVDDDLDDDTPQKKRSCTTKKTSRSRAKTKDSALSSGGRKHSAPKKKSSSRIDSDDDDEPTGYGRGSSIDLDDDWGTAGTRSQL